MIIWRYIDADPSAIFYISRLIFYPTIYYQVQNVLPCTMTSGTWTRSFSHCWFISEAFSISLPIIPTSFACFFSSNIESIIYAFPISSWVLCSRILYSVIVIMMIRWAKKRKIDGVCRCEICHIPPPFFFLVGPNMFLSPFVTQFCGWSLVYYRCEG